MASNSLRIGVKRIGDGAITATPDEDAKASVQVVWAEMAGVFLPQQWEETLISVDYHADGTSPHTATIKFFVSDFETVDHRKREEGEREND